MLGKKRYTSGGQLMLLDSLTFISAVQGAKHFAAEAAVGGTICKESVTAVSHLQLIVGQVKDAVHRRVPAITDISATHHQPSKKKQYRHTSIVHMKLFRCTTTGSPKQSLHHAIS
jgi:hypothetical protein